jgi:hypothetical protein
MTKERFAEIKKEYGVTSDEVDRAIGIVITLLEEEIIDLEQAEYDTNYVDIAADEVAALCEYIEEVM